MLGCCSTRGRCCHHQTQGAGSLKREPLIGTTATVMLTDWRLQPKRSNTYGWMGTRGEGNSPLQWPSSLEIHRFTSGEEGSGRSVSFDTLNTVELLSHRFTGHDSHFQRTTSETTLFRYCKCWPALEIPLSSFSFGFKCHNITDETLKRYLFSACINSLKFYSYLI